MRSDSPQSVASSRSVLTDSKQLAGLIGPVMVAVGVTEACNIEIFAHQIAPVVYLNGAMLFVAGLAIVRAHNLWTWRWPMIVTLSGWTTLLGGLWRMIAPNAQQAAENFQTYTALASIVAIGTILSAAAYWSKTD